MTKGSGRPKRQMIALDMFETLVNRLERDVANGARMLHVVNPLNDVRSMEKKLTDQQVLDPRYPALARRAKDAETAYRERDNPVAVMQHRITTALERLQQEPDSDLKRELLEILAPSSKDAPTP